LRRSFGIIRLLISGFLKDPESQYLHHLPADDIIKFWNCKYRFQFFLNESLPLPAKEKG
jgi:hypothetical protein